MKRFIHGLAIALGMTILRNYRRLSGDLLRIEATKAYVKGVQGARHAFIGVMALGVILLLLGVAFVMVHVGFFLWVPWEPRTKAGLLAILGAVYGLVAVAVLLKLCSQRTWMRMSQADKLVERATRKR